MTQAAKLYPAELQHRNLAMVPGAPDAPDVKTKTESCLGGKSHPPSVFTRIGKPTFSILTAAVAFRSN